MFRPELAPIGVVSGDRRLNRLDSSFVIEITPGEPERKLTHILRLYNIELRRGQGENNGFLRTLAPVRQARVRRCAGAGEMNYAAQIPQVRRATTAQGYVEIDNPDDGHAAAAGAARLILPLMVRAA